MNAKTILLSLTMLALSAGLIQAQGTESVINVDFQPGPSGSAHSTTYTGSGALDDADHDFWNAVEPPVDGYASSWGSGGNFSFVGTYSLGALLDSEGAKTPVEVSISEGVPRGTTFAVNPENLWAFEHVADDAKDLMKDYLIAPGGGTNLVVISPLVRGARYTLYLYGAGDQDAHQTAFTVGGLTKTTEGVPNASHDMRNGGDYVVFENVEAVDGSLSILYVGAGSSRDGNFNGFQLKGKLPDMDADSPGGNVP
ncbi:MAG: hypothetical protein KJ626_14925 [Verrucomicrobia bacterium]|nr:hypothetical protein [Verrucomicrobiota bacterium]